MHLRQSEGVPLVSRRPIHELRIWSAEDSTQADSGFQGVELLGPYLRAPQKLGLGDSWFAASSLSDWPHSDSLSPSPRGGSEKGDQTKNKHQSHVPEPGSRLGRSARRRGRHRRSVLVGGSVRGVGRRLRRRPVGQPLRLRLEGHHCGRPRPAQGGVDLVVVRRRRVIGHARGVADQHVPGLVLAAGSAAQGEQPAPQAPGARGGGLRRAGSPRGPLDTLQRGVQWEGGAVDGGSII